MRQSINEDGPTLSRQHSSSPENERIVGRSSSKNSGGSLSPASSISLVSLKLSSLSTASSSSSSSTVSSSSTGTASTVKPAVNGKSSHFNKVSNNSNSPANPTKSLFNGSISGHPHHPSAVTANKGTSTTSSSAASILQKHHHHRQQSTGSLKSLHSLTSSPSSSSSSNKRTDSKHHLMGLDDFDIIKTIGTGTFGRVVLVYDKEHREYGALKILQLSDVIRLKQVDHVKNEKNILQQVKHPFVVNLKWHHKDEYNIYMLFEYVCGGELFSYLRNAGHFSSSTSSFYAAEIICALEYLHARSIVYRDLKPENLLLDREGHLKITDFGFAKKLTDRTWTLCGTPEYLAPEIIQSKGHNKAVDWWALGVLIYEMLCGYPPFSDDNNFSTYEKILSGKIDWPKSFDPVAKDLVKKLLTNDRTKRIGCMKNGPEDVKRHRWFREYDWEDVKNRRLNPPIIPKVSFDGDTRNFDEYPEEESFRVNGITKAQLELFADF